MISIEQLYELYQKHPVICTDTRKITPGCLFFALKGENFDGNRFAENALDAGAAYAVIDAPMGQENERFVRVADGLKALQDLAKWHRRQLLIPIIGITGTNGKTTTKELVNSVLSQHYQTYATQGNLNNHIGVPLTLLAINSEIELAIIEMGANHQKEIEFLCEIAQPTHGLITNVGKAHLEGFGGLEGVKIAKGELYAYLAKTNGITFINRNNQQLIDMSRDHQLEEVVFYGTGMDTYISGNLKESSPFLMVEWERQRMEFDDHKHMVSSRLTGTYNFENILAAICIGNFFNLTPEEVNQGIAAYTPSNNRSQLTQTEHNMLICDYYNANPSSMIVALENLDKLPADHKVMILGDMFELGNESRQEHEQILQKALEVNADQRIFIGEEFYKLSKQANGMFYRTTKEAYEALKAKPIKNATILVKGSRGMKLENLMELF